MNELIPSDVVSEIVANRNAAVAAYERYFGAIKDAQQHLIAAHEAITKACDGEYRSPYSDKHRGEIDAFRRMTSELPDPDATMTTARRLTDVIIWGAVIERTELETLMDKEAKDELRKAMEFVPEKVDKRRGVIINQDDLDQALPPITEDNIHATLDQFREDAGEIWRRGVANAFSNLDRRFRTHDGFKVGNRIIISGAFNGGSWCYWRNHRDTLIDIERVFLVLDGKSPNSKKRPDDPEREPAHVGIVAQIDEASRRRERCQHKHRGDYFEARCFMNGNIHLWFSRPDLVKKVNLLLADHYGAGLGWGKADCEDPDAPFEGGALRAPAKNHGLFPTPDELADKIVEDLQIASETPLMILEPSAGTGQLSSRVVEPAYHGVSDHWREQMAKRHRVTVVEIQPELAAGLRRDGRYAAVYERDFLKMDPDPVYDRILMNPPFDRGRDVDHVNHALKFLKPGGRLIAIMSAAVEFSEAPRAVAFRKKVKALKGHFSDLPPGSFREVGTNVNTVTLTVWT